jgi:hypothetical protein
MMRICPACDKEFDEDIDGIHITEDGLRICFFCDMAIKNSEEEG